MKKTLAIFLTVSIIISSILVGCAEKNEEKQTTTNPIGVEDGGLEGNQDTYVMDEVPVTDKNGEPVTDENGNQVVEEVIYKQVTDKKGNKVLALIDDEGEVVTKKNGNVVIAVQDKNGEIEKNDKGEVVTDTVKTTVPVVTTTKPIKGTTVVMNNGTTQIIDTTKPIKGTTVVMNNGTTQIINTTKPIKGTTVVINNGTTQVVESTTGTQTTIPIPGTTVVIHNSTSKVATTTPHIPGTTVVIHNSTSKVVTTTHHIPGTTMVVDKKTTVAIDHGTTAQVINGTTSKPTTKKTTTKKTNKTTNKVTNKTTVKPTNSSSTIKTTTTTIKATGGEKTTKKQVTTLPAKDDDTPTPSDKGDTVLINAADQQTIKAMLEVPYLYKANYDSNSSSVPTEIAAHAAIWMANREGLRTETFASGTIVLDLFKFFGQTVVNFKMKCNDEKGNANITYNSSNDTFKIPFTNKNAQSVAEAKKQSVKLTKIEDLGNNNYYKVTGTVTNAGSIKKVEAVVQRNNLDSTLKFSIKGLKWS